MNLDGPSPDERLDAASPWKRGHDEFGGALLISRHSFWEEFDDRVHANIDLNIDTKRAALKISASVVSLVSLTGCWNIPVKQRERRTPRRKFLNWEKMLVNR
ncbi:hypothetical protein RHMOL_Rhmol09G0071500 [Rhododendron molle]|uniref:Uncharacterized protein n=1 Tax=Rhododendron molle TaxID=49168 RepID=A0ACC0MAH7_RHOML|nr:hypothetical protein RHMOL_Rhmol09G0071500 [Rhododendron molle]